MSARSIEFSRRLLLSADVVGYGAGDDQRQRMIQTDLLAVLDRAATNVGLDRSRWAKQQAGDGELAVLPAAQSDQEPVVVDDFTRELGVALARHNEDLQDSARLRLRLAVHFGSAAPADNGFAGKGVVVVSRLVECAQIKEALHTVEAADLAVILSQQVYSDVIVPRYTSLRKTLFRKVSVRLKEFSESGYLFLPGYDISNVELEEKKPPKAPTVSGAQPAVDGNDPEPSSRGEESSVSNTFYGDVNQTNGVIGMVWNT